MNATIKSSRDIKVGQFYRANGAAGYYYVGIRFRSGKRLLCINMTENESGQARDLCPLFPNCRTMYKEWEFVPCSQHEASHCR